MVFQHRDGKSMVNGRLIGTGPAQQPLRLGKHRLLTAEQVVKRHPAEPFPPITEFGAQSVEARVSVACELAMWVEQRLDEMATLADEWNWLHLQLREPALEHHPLRPNAMNRKKGMEDQLAELASDVAYLEAHADRIWQSLEEDERDDVAAHWVAEVDDDRLIMHAWTRIAQVGFRWPDYFEVSGQWFNCLSPVLTDDMEAHGLRDGVHLGKRHEWDEP